MRVRKSIRYRREDEFKELESPFYKGGPVESLLRNQCKRVILEFADGSAEAFEADDDRTRAVTRIERLISQDLEHNASHYYITPEVCNEMLNIRNKLRGAFTQ